MFVTISAFLVLQMPPVQNYLISHYLKDFTTVTGFPTTVRSFSMLWFDRLELDGVNVYDPEGNRMISSEQIVINFKLSNLFEKNDINVDGIFIDSAHVYLTKIQESDTSRDLNINVLITRINDNFSSGSSSGGKPPKINIGEAFLNQSRFTYVNQDRDSIRHGFDYNHFSLAVDESQLRSFVVLGDTIEFDLKTLIAQDQRTGFGIRQLSTFFRISQQSMEFVGLNLQAGESVITDTIIFNYKSQRDLNDFVEKVKVHANLHNTTLFPKDLAVFAPGVEQIDKPIRVEGIFNGRINKFKFTKMDVSLGNTRLTGSLDMDGLPTIHETFINLNLRNSRLDPADLSFLLNNQVLNRLKPMGHVTMNGQFLGYPSDFVANGSFSGRLGSIRSDINFKVNEENFDRSTYSGRISLSSFDMGAYFNDTTLFQQVNLDGKVSGSGLTQETADFLLNGKVTSIGIYGYNYTNILTDARFASGLFRGLLAIDDPNLQLKARGSIDLREGRNQIRISAQLDTAYLHKLNLSREPLFLHTGLNADISGLTLDSLQGVADLTDLKVGYRDQWLTLDRVHIDAQHDRTNRSIRIESPIADLVAKGNYLYSDISRDLQILSREISLNIRNDKQEIATYYRQKTYSPKTYNATIAVNLKNIKPVAKLLNLDLKLSPNTVIEGHFTSGRTTIFNAYTVFDSLTYQGSTFVRNEADITVSKIADSTSVLAMATVTSGQQIINKNLETKNLLAEAIWNKSHIDFGLDADQSNRPNSVRLKGAVDFMRDSTMVSMSPSALKLLERDWTFAPDNFVAIKGSDWNFHNLALVNAEQSIALNGGLSKDPKKVISLTVSKLDLSLLDVLSTEKFKGVMDAQIDLSNYYHDPSVQNDILIQGLTVNDFLVGDIHGKNQWDTLHNEFDIDLFVDRESKRIVNLTGGYTPSNKESPLNVTAKLDQAELKILEPFLNDIFTQIGGTISGDFKITGPLNSPLIAGEGHTGNGQLMVNYLKTMYRFTGIVGLTPTSIYFKDIDLTDVFRNKGKLSGTITHQNFYRMFVNLDASFRSLQVMNTTGKDNSLFFGQVYATGEVNFYGPVSNLKITSTARTERNTRVYIPIGGTASVEKKDFITFVNFKDTTFTKKIEKNPASNKVDLTGLTFDLNLDVTPDAYCEIIFDLKSGDIIRGRGNGDLKLQLDTKGEFNMFGPFEFTEGWYNFTMYDIINKEFEIRKGSRITWYGDPYQAILDLNASYNQLASLAPLFSTTGDENLMNTPAIRRKYPVQVLLRLEGQMLSPDINFDIVATDLPQSVATNSEQYRQVNLAIEFTAFRNRLDEQELKRQVFSLIVLRRISAPESFDASGSVGNSVSELLSNQLSNWMSQVDENLQIDVDLGTFDENAFNTLQLRLSYTFLNGRLRVTGDGTFNNTSTPTTTTPNPSNPGALPQANPSSVAGDWTVDYKLTADGKLRIKMYSRTNTNTVLSSVNNQSTITTGASIIHTQSFNELKDLWRSTRKKREKEQAKGENNKEAIQDEEDGGGE